MATLEVVERIIKALGLAQPEADALKAAAGFLPEAAMLCRYPIVSQLDSAIADAPDDLQHDALEIVRALLAMVAKRTERAHTP
jgi:hypothetical protein